LLALLAAEWPDREPLDRAAQLLISRQDANGDWPHESIVGVFNASCMITYMNYRNVFALKALNRYCKRFGIKQ
jgi:lanosterol synthase